MRKVHVNRRISAPKLAKELKNEYNVDVSAQTVRRRIHNSSFSGGIAVKKPLLSKKNIKLRLKWAREKVGWSAAQWKKVIWSDETKIMLFGSDGIIRCWRKKGERLKMNCLRPTVKHGGG